MYTNYINHDGYLVGYHSTSLEKYNKILQHGFLYNGGYKEPIIFFTSSPNFAYGNICIAVDLTNENFDIIDVSKQHINLRGTKTILLQDLIIHCKQNSINRDKIIGKIEK